MHYSNDEQISYQKQKLAYHIGRLHSLGISPQAIVELTEQILKEKEKGKQNRQGQEGERE